MSEPLTLADLDASDAICKALLPENRYQTATGEFWRAMAHAQHAFPLLIQQCRQLLELIPYVQHKPDCDSLVNYGMGCGLCTCGLRERLDALGLGGGE